MMEVGANTLPLPMAGGTDLAKRVVLAVVGQNQLLVQVEAMMITVGRMTPMATLRKSIQERSQLRGIISTIQKVSRTRVVTRISSLTSVQLEVLHSRTDRKL